MSLKTELNKRVELSKVLVNCKDGGDKHLEYLISTVRSEADDGKNSCEFVSLNENNVKYLQNYDLHVVKISDKNATWLVSWGSNTKEIIKNSLPKDSIDIKMWDLVIEMGFTASAGLAREWILGGKVKVDKKIIKDNKAMVIVTQDSIVEVKDATYQKADKMRVGDNLPYFKYTLAGSLLR